MPTAPIGEIEAGLPTCKALVSLAEVYDLSEVSVRQIYVDASRQLQMKAHADVCRMLSPTNGDFDVMDELMLGDAYLGARGVLPLIPALAVCTKLAVLNLSNNGLRDGPALLLLELLTGHPCIQTINLSRNDVGAPVGKKILEMFNATPSLCDVQIEETLIVAPLARKISAKCRMLPSAPNTAKTLPFLSHPSSRGAYTPRQMQSSAGKEWSERQASLQLSITPRGSTANGSFQITFADLRGMVSDVPSYSPTNRTTPALSKIESAPPARGNPDGRLPLPWVFDALAEIAAALWTHRNHMNDIYAIFTPYCSIEIFLRGMLVLGVKFFADPLYENQASDRCATVAAVVNCFANSQVNAHALLYRLRVHAGVFSPPSSDESVAMTAVADSLYDSRNSFSEIKEITVNEFFAASDNLICQGPMGLLSSKDKALGLSQLIERVYGEGPLLPEDIVVLPQFLESLCMPVDPMFHQWYLVNNVVRDLFQRYGPQQNPNYYQQL